MEVLGALERNAIIRDVFDNACSTTHAMYIENNITRYSFGQPISRHGCDAHTAGVPDVNDLGPHPLQRAVTGTHGRVHAGGEETLTPESAAGTQE